MPFLAPAIAAISAFLAPAITFATSTFVGRLLVSVAASALMQALAPKPKKGQAGGISTQFTQSGGLNPAAFVVGKYATAGTNICPPMSHGTVGGSPLAYLTYVIALGDLPGQTLSRVMINDEYVTLGNPVNSGFGQSVQGRYQGYAWVRYYDGSQTVADPDLITNYGSYPNRPWSSAMIGRGLCYAIVTFRLNPELYQGLPRVRFEMSGIPLYDIRKDSTAGGSGTQRWATPSTWAQTTNPMVIIYNILRGISIPSSGVWGGEIAAANLPAGAWMAAMNECDVASPAVGGGTEAQFRTGLEITLDQEPADLIAELLKACSGQLVEVGGRWKPRAGGPGLPVYFFTDADIVITQAQDFSPFPGLEASFNGIHASYPEPDSLWESKDAPPRYNATYEAEDQGRRRVAELGLPAVPFPAQVQRLMVAYIKEERRFRRHGLTLPPDAAILEPLDAVSWTSAANGYVSKVFEVSAVTDNLRTCLQRVSLRERDPADYSYPSDILLPSAPSVPGTNVPAAQGVAGWNVAGVSITDAAAAPRRPGLLLSWTGTDQDDVRAIRVEVRVTATGAIVHRGSYHDVSVGQTIISAGMLPNTSYQARARFVVDRATTWSAWVATTTPNVGISNADFVGGIGGFLNGEQASWGEVVSTLPGTGNWFGRQVILSSDGKNYIWNGSAWVTGVAAADILGPLTTSNFATTLRPPETVTSLPTSGNYLGRLVFLTTDQKLYRHSGSPVGSAGFRRDVDGADLVANSVIGGSFVAGAVATADLAAGAASIEKLTISDFINRIEDPGGELLGRGWILGGAADDWYSSPAIPRTGTRVMRRDYTGPALSATCDNRFKFTASAGQVYLAKFWGRTASSYAGGQAGLNVIWLDAAGTLISSSSVLATLTATYSFKSGSVTAPAGTASAYVRLVVLGQTAGIVIIDDMFLAEQNAGELVVDGFLAVMGMSAFGGDLQSTGFIPGLAGWRIRSTGAAEFSTATIRAGLQDGAITDQFQTIVAGPLDIPVGEGPVVLATLSLGAVPRGNIYLRGVVFEARRTAGVGLFTVELSRRLKQLGGAFSAWGVIQSWNVNSAGYEVYQDAGNLAGYYDAFEYMLTGDYSPGQLAGVRNIYLTVTRTTK